MMVEPRDKAIYRHQCGQYVGLAETIIVIDGRFYLLHLRI